MRATAILISLACSWRGCHDSDDTGSDDTSSGDTGMHSLADIVDLSVNQASAGVSDDADGGLRLRTESGDNEVGGFNGTGTGNKAIAGLPGFDGMALADLGGLAFETRGVTGSSTPYFNLVVDLDCTGATYKIIVADATEVAAPTTVSGDVLRYEFLADAPQWKAVGALDDLLPSHLASGAGGRLSDVVAAWPDACLRDAATGDNGMPAGVATTAVMLILGDSLNTSELEHRVSAIEVGAERYEAP